MEESNGAGVGFCPLERGCFHEWEGDEDGQCFVSGMSER